MSKGARRSPRHASLSPRMIWTPELDAELLRLTGEKVLQKQIGVLLGCTQEAVWRRISRLRHAGMGIPDARAHNGRKRVQVDVPSVSLPSARRCLRCRHEFTSAGKHNRVCDACKATVDWRFGVNDLSVSKGLGG